MPRFRLKEAHYTEEDKYLLGDKETEEDDKLPITGREVDEEGNPVYDADGREIVYRGTIVGDGTPHKWTRPPSPHMVGLDKKSQQLVDDVIAAGADTDPIDKLPLTMSSMEELEANARALGFRLEPLHA